MAKRKCRKYTDEFKAEAVKEPVRQRRIPDGTEEPRHELQYEPKGRTFVA